MKRLTLAQFRRETVFFVEGMRASISCRCFLAKDAQKTSLTVAATRTEWRLVL